MPVNKRSVARGTGDMVVNKLGKALVEDGLARGELRVPLQWPSLARKMLPDAVAEDVTMELLAKLAVVWELKAWWSETDEQERKLLKPLTRSPMPPPPPPPPPPLLDAPWSPRTPRPRTPIPLEVAQALSIGGPDFSLTCKAKEKGTYSNDYCSTLWQPRLCAKGLWTRFIS